MPLLQPSWRGRAICDHSRSGTSGHSPIPGPLTTDDQLPIFTNLPEEVAWHQPRPVGERINGPLARPVHSFTYDSKSNRHTQSSPLINTLSWTYDATYARVTQAVDENGNLFRQAIDAATGLVTEQTRHFAGWQQYFEPKDVSLDGFIDYADGQLIVDYLNRHGPQPSGQRDFDEPVFDVNNDGYITAIDALQIFSYVTSNPDPGSRYVPRNAMGVRASYQYAATPLKGQVTQLSLTTGRATGNQITQYQYYSTPGTWSTHGQLHYVIESPARTGDHRTELRQSRQRLAQSSIRPAGSRSSITTRGTAWEARHTGFYGSKEAAGGGARSAERDWETPLAVKRRRGSRVGRSAAQTVIADAAGGAKKAGNRAPILRGSLKAAGSTPRVVT